MITRYRECSLRIKANKQGKQNYRAGVNDPKTKAIYLYNCCNNHRVKLVNSFSLNPQQNLSWSEGRIQKNIAALNCCLSFKLGANQAAYCFYNQRGIPDLSCSVISRLAQVLMVLYVHCFIYTRRLQYCTPIVRRNVRWICVHFQPPVILGIYVENLSMTWNCNLLWSEYVIYAHYHTENQSGWVQKYCKNQTCEAQKQCSTSKYL